MIKGKNDNVKKGIIYVTISNIINLIISLLTGFILPKYLSIETYAEIKLFQLYISYIGILHLGYSDGMYLRYGGKKVEELSSSNVREEFNTFKLFQFVVFLLFLFINVFIKNRMLLLITLVILPINISNYIKNLYNACGQFKKYSFYTNINTALLFLINIILLLIVKTDSSILYLSAYVLIYFIYWIFIEHENNKLFEYRKVKYNINYIRDNIKSGFFLMIGNFCNVIFTSIDRLFVKYLLGTVFFAYYSFAVSVENLLNVFITPVSTVMYNYFCNNNSRESIDTIKKYLIIFATYIISTIFFIKQIVETYLTKYSDSLSVLVILVGAQYISIIVRCVHLNLYKSHKKQNKYFVIMLIIVILSAILNLISYIFFKKMIYIAVATLIINIIWFIIGECDFKNYRMKITDYVTIYFILIVYLLCGILLTPILGLCIYIAVSTIILYLFQNEIVKKIIINIKSLNIKKIIK